VLFERALSTSETSPCTHPAHKPYALSLPIRGSVGVAAVFCFLGYRKTFRALKSRGLCSRGFSQQVREDSGCFGLRLLVGHRLGQFSERFVGRLFLGQGLFEQLRSVGEPEFFGPCLERAVAAYLVVLDGLGG
jgi:hypothetical protein